MQTNQTYPKLSVYRYPGQEEAPEQHREKMSQSSIHRHLLSIASDPSTAGRDLEKLAMTPNATIRAAVARNPSAPVELAYYLALDKDPEVRLVLAQDPSTPLDILRRLARDENWDVSQRAKDTVDFLGELTEQSSLESLI